MNFTELRAAFLTDFGVTATVGVAPATTTVRGLFDADWQDAMGIVPGTIPIIVCQSEDVADLAIETPMMIQGTPYVITKKEPDGTGFTRLRLESV